MHERRKAMRAAASKTGAVSFGVAAIAGCTIVNLSKAGACLDFAFRPVLPKRFSVLILPDYTRRICRLVWQSQSRVGLEFVDGR